MRNINIYKYRSFIYYEINKRYINNEKKSFQGVGSSSIAKK